MHSLRPARLPKRWPFLKEELEKLKYKIAGELDKQISGDR